MYKTLLKIMRSISWKTFVIAGFVINVFLALIMLTHMDSDCACTVYEKRMSYIHTKSDLHKDDVLHSNNSINHVTQTSAIIIREFENFENEISSTINSIIKNIPSIKIFIISDTLPYPPLLVDVYNENVKIISLKSSVNKPFELQQPFNIIEKDHLFIFPDSVKLENISQISKMLKYHYENPNNIIAAPVEDEELLCLSLNVSLRYWTMKYREKVGSDICNVLQGTQVILVPKNLLMQLGFPFANPFTTSLYIQATLQKIEVIFF